MIRRSIRLTFGAKAQPGITLQRGDCFSTAICAQCYAPNGCPVSFEGRTVHVVYQTGGQSSPGYEVEARDNVLTWTLPPCAAQTAGPGKMQLMVYGADSLLHSAVIPYTVLDSLEPGEGGEDPVPALVLLLDKAQAAISGANAAASTANQVAQIADTAANLASEKAGLAQNAASSANEAATNATNSAELAQTAADNANSASESANSAAGTANNAADNANSAAESANSAATNANQVADEIQQKADSGAFNGKDGLNAPQIDDTQITTTNPWSSMQIVKTLCPPFTVSGSVVQCYPVANYPLGVKVAWEPHQEGEGEPSPENVRPIVGLDEVQVARCGKNLMPYNKPSPSTYTAKGITFTWNDDGSIHIIGTAVGQTSSNIMWFDDFSIPPGKYRMIGPSTLGASPQFVVKKADTGANFWYNAMNPVTIENGDVPQYFYVLIADGTVVDDTIYAFLSYGSDIPTDNDYVPYTGTTATLTLPETIYGGTVDVATGEGAKTIHGAVLDGTENWILNVQMGNSGINGYQTPLEFLADDSYDCVCSHFGGMRWNGVLKEDSVAVTSQVIVVRTNGSETLEDWKSFLAAQYAAGTPVTIAYKLATPTPFQATGGQSIPALPGTNTVYTDAGNITVTGASDPIATITSLQSRVSALESAQTNM